LNELYDIHFKDLGALNPSGHTFSVSEWHTFPADVFLWGSIYLNFRTDRTHAARTAAVSQLNDGPMQSTAFHWQGRKPFNGQYLGAHLGQLFSRLIQLAAFIGDIHVQEQKNTGRQVKGKLPTRVKVS